MIAFNESGNTFKKITSGTDTGNLPTDNVRAVAIDAKDQLWIGTGKGLRVLSNIGSFQNDAQLKANSIIIMEDNLAQGNFFVLGPPFFTFEK
ncbi:two-component regulator propeller domain-containing protein [Flavobacterium procerum]